MPPKKNDKAKKGGNTGPKEIIADSYVREAIKLTDINIEDINAASSARLSGELFNISTQFAEWDDEDNWTEALTEEFVISLQFPPLIGVSAVRPIKEFLNLVDDGAIAGMDKGKVKKDPAKKGVKTAEIIEEAAFDELNRALPRVFVDSATVSSNAAPVDNMEHSRNQLMRKFRVKDDNSGDTDVGSSINNFFSAEIDPLICAAFKLVNRFAPTLVANSECPYLWRAIFPQNQQGRPYFNSSGKYCVKLFIAGKWRKVYVNDDVPVDAQGIPAVASSSVAHELWPMLIAKAIYTVYTAFGYQQIFGRLGASENESGNQSSALAGAFVAFAVHLLTGWLPASPETAPIPNNETESDECGSFLQDVAFGGCHCIEAKQKLRSHPIHATEIEINESQYQGKLTKKIIKDLEETKLVKSEHLKKIICKREREITLMTEAINKVYNEIFCVVLCSKDSKKFCVLPILAICSDRISTSDIPGSPGKTPSHALGSPTKSSPQNRSMNSVEILVEWSLGEYVSTGLDLSDGSSSNSDPVSREIQNWRRSTSIAQVWIPYSDISAAGMNVISFETRFRTANCKDMHWSWIPVISSNTIDTGKGKGAPPAKGGKDKKGNSETGVSLSSLGVPIAGVDPGIFPPTLLHIDVKDFAQRTFNNMQATAKHNELDPEMFLSLCVFLHCDVLKNAEVNHGGIIDHSSLCVPDDVVVVLQEIRRDDEDPLVMRVAINRNMLLFPVTRTTFHIPAYRVLMNAQDADKTQNIVFSVRVMTKGSVHLTFTSSSPLVLGLADKVWQDQGEGSVVNLEGECNIVRSDFETLVLRSAFEGTLLSDSLTINPLHNMKSSNNISGHKALLFLHISDRSANSCVGVAEVSPETSGCCLFLPRLQSNIVLLSKVDKGDVDKVGVTLIVRCFSKFVAIGSFKWKLSLLARSELNIKNNWISVPLLMNPAAPTPVKRFGGCYTPNNRLVMFRDQLKVVVQDAPVAFRVSILPLLFDESKNEDDVWFIVRFIRPNDRSVLREFRGRGIIPIYLVDLKQFLQQDGSSIADTSKATKKDEKSTKAGKGVVLDETVDMIMECLLDESAMIIPLTWRSRVPYTFSAQTLPILCSALNSAPTGSSSDPVEGGSSFVIPPSVVTPTAEGPQWVVDVLSGVVNNISHDLYDLNRFCNIKNSWLDNSADRFDRAISAYSYNAARLSTRNIEKSIEDDIVGLLASALDKASEDLKPLETLLHSIPKYIEYVSESKHPSLVPPLCQEELNKISAESATVINRAESSLKKMNDLNLGLREDTLNRINEIIFTAEHDNFALRDVWRKREQARIILEKQNASLSFLLDRAIDSKTKIFAPDEDTKVKNPAKGKKK